MRLHQSEIEVDDCGRGAVVLVGLQQRGLAASRVVGMTADGFLTLAVSFVDGSLVRLSHSNAKHDEAVELEAAMEWKDTSPNIRDTFAITAAL